MSVARHLSDREIAERIGRDQEYDGRRFRLGEYVAVLDGRVVAVTETFEAAEDALAAVDPDPRHGLICVVEPPLPDVIR